MRTEDQLLAFVGCKFNKLKITSIGEKKLSGTRYYNTANCICECGKTINVILTEVSSGKTKSCGCTRRETRRSKHIGEYKSEHPLYQVWAKMKSRCYDKNSKSYHNYGGRGIIVCDGWLSISTAFIEWAKDNGWAKGLEIDRINNDGNYEPSNCHFVTRKVNTRNRRKAIYYEYKGESKRLYEWSEISGIPYPRLENRIRTKKWTIAKAIETPVKYTYPPPKRNQDKYYFNS